MHLPEDWSRVLLCSLVLFWCRPPLSISSFSMTIRPLRQGRAWALLSFFHVCSPATRIFCLSQPLIGQNRDEAPLRAIFPTLATLVIFFIIWSYRLRFKL